MADGYQPSVMDLLADHPEGSHQRLPGGVDVGGVGQQMAEAGVPQPRGRVVADGVYVAGHSAFGGHEQPVADR